MVTQIHVFISGMNAGNQRFYLTRKTPSTLKEAFAIALCEDYNVTASQATGTNGSGCDSTLRRTSGADVINTDAAFTFGTHTSSDEVLPVSEAWSLRGSVPCANPSGDEHLSRERRRRCSPSKTGDNQ
ncbi:polyprotein [Phytophthora palmivora]|uniref:Polyprotein n=1 Tax=Phytophthora palmivora TaxID=4796 RepID=A0A2P4X4W5_9STRA|nr:polyprotein [Phytophthora palmivora]